MAVARSPARSDRSAPVDARIACPQCGGLIHPIAGRCKHCKHDLSASRAARPAAPVALPPLASNRTQPYVSPASGATVVPGAAPPRAPVPSTVDIAQPHAVVALPVGRDDSRPILPPRPTGRVTTSGTRTTWRSWPMVVIGVAVLAIAAAVVMLVWPHDDAAAAGAAGTRGAPPPAPDRMETNPMPSPPPRAPNGSKDPWSGPGPAQPAAPVQPAPSADIDAIPDPDPDSLRDPFLAPGPGSPSSMGALQSSAAMISAMVVHACDRMAACPQVDTTVATVCTAARQTLGSSSAGAPSCPAAARCLARIDRMSCDDLVGPDSDLSTSFLMSMATSVQDCMSAMQC